MITVLVALVLAAQDNVPPSQSDIERAIKAGTEAMLVRAPGIASGELSSPYGEGYGYAPLALYTLVHSGASLQDERGEGLIAVVVNSPLLRTYQVSLSAAALAAIDPWKYQDKLAKCAQYLVDFQCDNGQWSYGEKYDPAATAPPGAGANQTIAKIRIKRLKKLGPPVGDNSNAQYAALGLKACAAGGIEIDSATLVKATEWWEKSQQKGGGWGYNLKGAVSDTVDAYGSMTAGAVSSLIMLRQMRNSDSKNAPAILRGLAWLGGHFEVDRNPGSPVGLEDWRYYFLYAVERVGDLYPTEKLGKRAWYAEGAAHLLKTQRSDGNWIGANSRLMVADTCFALLFLQRVARRAPVATGGKPAPAPEK